MMTISQKTAEIPNGQDPNLIHHLSEAKQAVWQVLKSNWTKVRDGEFKVDVGAIAAEIGYSRAAVHYALKALVSGNLLEKVRSVTGRGNHSVFRFLWSFYPESVTPPRITTLFDSPPRCITKDSPGYRYFAMKFRRIIEESEHLAPEETGVTGKLLKILSGKERDVWKTAKIFLRRKVNEGLDLQGFFVWLNDFLYPEINRKQTKEKQQQSIREERKAKKEELEKLSGEPPKLKDFKDFESYQKAYDNYLENQP